MAMEDFSGEMGSLSTEMGNLRGEMEEDCFTEQQQQQSQQEDEDQKDLKQKTDQTKPEDLDGLQMLRLPQEDDKSLVRKDVLRDEASVDTSLEELGDENDQSTKETIGLEDDHVLVRKSLKNNGVDGAVKPALVKKEVSELSSLTERQQKILQDFHVKFVLEGVVSVDKDDEEESSRARKHEEFVELKKRLEEEEKMYAGCALGEATDLVDGSEKDQGDIDPSTMMARENESTTHAPPNSKEDIDSATPGGVPVRATMDGVITSLARVAICRREEPTPVGAEAEEGYLKKLEQQRPQNVRNAMKGLADDDESLSQLQEYTNREGSVECQCCCRKAGKQIDEGDENDMYMTHASYSVLNVVCPISGIPVVELEDPVRSEECEHIYDRASALNYITSMAKDGFCLCASPGCRALLAENKLITDNRLWQDIEELRQIKAAVWESRMLQDSVNIDDSDDDD